ncbi:MAG: hypothetical protein PHC39_04630 [Proteiniphilum sp.]|nr:hypothetical protein [Proteiniphilum sp.]
MTKTTIEVCNEVRDNYRKYQAVHVYSDGSMILQYDVDRKSGCDHSMYTIKEDGREDLVFCDVSNGAYVLPEFARLEILENPELVALIRARYPWQKTI